MTSSISARSDNRSFSRPWLWLVAAAGLGIVLASTFLWSSNTPSDAIPAPITVDGRDRVYFADVAEMTAGSDVVGTFHVLSVETLDATDSDLGPFSVTTAVLAVDTLIAGELTADTVTLMVDSASWPSELKGSGLDWLALGRPTLLALHRRDDNGFYRPTNSQSIFMVDKDSRLHPVFGSPLADRLTGQTVASFAAGTK